MQTVINILGRLLYVFVVGYVVGFGLATAALWIIAQLKGL